MMGGFTGLRGWSGWMMGSRQQLLALEGQVGFSLWGWAGAPALGTSLGLWGPFGFGNIRHPDT